MSSVEASNLVKNLLSSCEVLLSLSLPKHTLSYGNFFYIVTIYVASQCWNYLLES